MATVIINKTNRVVEVSEVGAQGAAGVGGLVYQHTQSTPATEWVVNHNMGRRPTVNVYTVGWVEMDALEVHASLNQVIIQMNSPMAGFVLCS